MVAIRDAHLNDALIVSPEEWVKGLGLEPTPTKALLDVVVYCKQWVNESEPSLTLWSGREMVEILTTLSMDQDTLCAAFLFPFVEAQHLSLTKLEEDFGVDLLHLVEGVLEMAAISQLNTKYADQETAAAQIDNLRRMLLSMVDDFRVW